MSLTPEDRDELATASLLAGRRNRPMGLVVLSSSLAGLTIVVLLWSAVSLHRTRTEHARKRDQLVETQQLVIDLAALREGGNGIENFQRDKGLLTKIESLATAAGLPKPTLPTEQRGQRGPIQETTLKYAQVRHDNIEQVLGWIQSVVEEIPGISVKELKIDPDPTRWRVDVSFALWESQS